MNHDEPVNERPPLRPPGRGWKHVLPLLGSAGLLMVSGQTYAVLSHSTEPKPPAQVFAADGGLSAEAAAEFPKKPTGDMFGPPVPGRAGMRMAKGGGLPGAIGYMGPISGQLNTSIPEGAVRGPNWNLTPLPAVGAGGPVYLSPSSKGPAVAAARSADPEASSELPDAHKLELSRLATPELQARPAEPKEPAQAAVTAQEPLHVSLSVVGRARGFEVGTLVTVRVSATTDAYLALIGIDAAGKASVLYRASSPSRRLARVLRAGPTAGPEYLLAVASVHPLESGDLGGMLRGSGAGFAGAAATDGGLGPGAAWNLAVAQAGSLGGGGRWDRHEWAVATASFAARPAPVVAKRPPVKPEAAKPGDTGTKPEEGSLLPPAAPEKKPDDPPAKPGEPETED